MTKVARTSMIVAALACLALPAAGADRLLPAGDARAAWVIRQDAPSQYGVVAKPVGEKWRWIAYDLPGEPVAAAALEGRLHVLLGGGGYLVFDLDSDKPAPGLKPNHPRWPGRANVLALCAAGPLARVQGQRTIVAVVAAANAPATTSRAASAPASGPPATGPAPQGLAIFCLQGGRWTYLEDAPASAGVAGQRVLAAAFDGELYLLLVAPEQTQMLVRDRSGAWLAPRAMNDLLPPGTSPLALLSNKDSLLLARLHRGASASRPLVDEVSLIAIEKDLKASAPQAIALPANARVTGVQAIAYADGVALVWPGAPAPGFAPCDPTGHVKTVEAVELLAQRPNDGRAEEAWRYFLYTLFALFLLSTFLRMRQGRVLFSLPAGLRPARLPRRALACMVDFIPFSLLGYQLFPFALPEAVNSTAEFMEFMQQQAADPNAALAVIATFALHGAYCLLTEMQFGATLGKRLMGLRVVGAGGRKPQAYEVLYRTVLRVLELGTLVGLAMAIGGMFLTRYRQRIGDLLAQTAVVEPSPILLPPPPPAGPPPIEPPPLPPPRPDNDRPANGPN